MIALCMPTPHVRGVIKAACLPAHDFSIGTPGRLRVFRRAAAGRRVGQLRVSIMLLTPGKVGFEC